MTVVFLPFSIYFLLLYYNYKGSAIITFKTNEVIVRSPEEGSNWRTLRGQSRARGWCSSPRVITPSEGEGLPKERLWQLDSESEWSNWLRPRSRQTAILFRTCSSFASLEERSDVVSSLPSYWQLRRASLCLLTSVSYSIQCSYRQNIQWHVFISQKRINRIFGQGDMGAI